VTDQKLTARYDPHAGAYRDWWGPIIAPASTRTLDRFPPAATSGAFELLDVGTGTGAIALAALARWPRARVVGVDPSSRMLEVAAAQARGRGSDRLRLVQGSADALPLPSGSVDLAASSFVIQLVPSRAAMLREVLRVLKPGGVFACTTWQAERPVFEPDDAFTAALEELAIDVPPDARDVRPYTSPRAAAAEFRRAGFRHVRAGRDLLEHRYTAETYLDVTEHWMERNLFAELDARTATTLRAAALRRLRRLDRGAFLWRRALVTIVGERAG
jgi:ubiquinone/menaquinone biosynthesis C-methylase UbiE